MESIVLALSEITQDIRTNYIQKVVSDASLKDVEIVKTELYFLAMYVIDGRIKNATDKSWGANQETIAKQYYSKCAGFSGLEIDSFGWLFFDKMNFYNNGVSKRVIRDINLQDRDDRLAAIGSIVGDLFAELCDSPGDSLYKVIGAGAFVTVSLSTDKLFEKSRIAR